MWEDIREWAAVVISIAAAFFAFRSIYYSKKSTRAAENAAEAAKRSAEAAESSAGSAAISAEADSKLAALAEAEASKFRIPWRIDPSPSGKGFTLTNDGDEPAFDVEIDGDVLVRNLRGTIGPRESLALIDSRSMGSAKPPVVTWSRSPEQGGERMTWTGEFP